MDPKNLEGIRVFTTDGDGRTTCRSEIILRNLDPEAYPDKSVYFDKIRDFLNDYLGVPEGFTACHREITINEAGTEVRQEVQSTEVYPGAFLGTQE